jgi:hypothetical protein
MDSPVMVMYRSRVCLAFSSCIISFYGFWLVRLRSPWGWLVWMLVTWSCSSNSGLSAPTLYIISINFIACCAFFLDWMWIHQVDHLGKVYCQSELFQFFSHVNSDSLNEGISYVQMFSLACGQLISDDSNSIYNG